MTSWGPEDQTRMPAVSPRGLSKSQLREQVHKKWGPPLLSKTTHTVPHSWRGKGNILAIQCPQPALTLLPVLEGFPMTPGQVTKPGSGDHTTPAP